jgi:phosphopentomutase
MRITRAIVIVLDGCGIGDAPDAAAFGDEGANTLVNTARAVGGLNCPNLARLGLGHLHDVAGVPPAPAPIGSFGKMRQRAAGKDSTSGHWELMGVTLTDPFPLYPQGFGPHILDPFMRRTGRGVIGNCPASGTEIIAELGQRHCRTGEWIVYTSADSVFQIAAHEEVVPIEELYRACRIARAILRGPDEVGRVIARPFVGTPGAFVRTHRRRDFSIEPPVPTVLDRMMAAGIPTIGIGKIDDLFAGRGLSITIHTHDNIDGMEKTIGALKEHPRGLIFTNLVEFDMLWGHRNDPCGFAAGLEEFDRRLGDLLPLLTSTDALFLVADHGVDPTTPSTDHSRELIPLLVYGPSLRSGANLGLRDTCADLAATLLDIFPAAASSPIAGATSFQRELVGG